MPVYQRTYRFRMCPNKTQEQTMLRQAGACRFVWNWALARRKAYYAEHGKGIPKSQLSSELTALKNQPKTIWLKEMEAQALQQVLTNLDQAFVAFFKRRARFPHFKSRKSTRPSFRTPQQGRVVDNKVYVPKIGWVKVRQSQPIDGQTKSATFKQDACLNWYVTLVAVFTMPNVALPKLNPKKTIGMDAGLTDFFVLSNGEREAAPKFYRKNQKKLRRAQRVLSRRKKGSKRRAKAKRRVATVHRKTANQRQDFLHKKSTDLIKRFDGICTENLCIKGLVKTKLAKSFLDASHGEFRRQLEYKAVWYRKYYVAVDRFYPSTKTCGECGTINNNLTLVDRKWFCLECGVEHDRDLNAANNIKAEGLRILAVGHTAV